MALCGTGPLAYAEISAELIHHFDFSSEKQLPAKEWLENQDFLLKHHATQSDKIELYHAEGAVINTEIDLREEFIKSFGSNNVPPVSGISIEVDTTETKNDGKAAAFLKRIEFLK